MAHWPDVATCDPHRSGPAHPRTANLPHKNGRCKSGPSPQFYYPSRECNHNHETNCERCDALENVITEVLQELENFGINEEKKVRMMFDYKEYLQDINAWKAHLLRSVNQKEAKQDVLDQLNEESCLIVMDWAMKFYPTISVNKWVGFLVSMVEVGTLVLLLLSWLPRNLKLNVLFTFSIHATKTALLLHPSLNIF